MEYSFSQFIKVYLNGQGIDAFGNSEDKVDDDCFMLMLNAYENDLEFKVPERKGIGEDPGKK